MAPLIAILIADDLTGSLDSIAPFAALGARCLTAVSGDDIGAARAHAPEVLAVNLGTRELPPEVARARAAAATRALVDAAGPDTLWIKKIDSRLKGPIAAEIEGMSEVLGTRRVILCPAIPELGRVVEGGKLRGHGILADLDVARTVGLPCEVPDAGSAAELDRLAARVGPGDLIATARGLASALAARRLPGRVAVPAPMPVGPVGFVIGSRDPVTLTQVAALRAEGGPDHFSALDGEVGPVVASSFVIQATPGKGAPGPAVVARLAEGVIRHTAGLASLLLTGGETAAAVLSAAGIRVLRTEGEVLPGLPVCRAVNVPGFPALVTKSGGFGPPDTLLRLWQAAQVSQGFPGP